MSSPAELRPVTDASVAAWIARRIGPFGSGVRSLVPAVFAAYVRILHPASAFDQTPVRWDAVAAWSGGSTHPLVEFEPISQVRDRSAGPAPFAQRPPDGTMPPATLQAVCDVLARHTTTPDRCFFGLWEGYGWADWMEPEWQRAARLALPQRTYLLFTGALESVADLGWRLPGPATPLHPESPNLIWPADWSWYVASEIDLDSTFVGGSEELIRDLLYDGRLEAWPSSPGDQVTAGTDVINREG